MLFNSFEFLIFFIIVTTLYFVLPHKFRWALLLVASCIFYMFFIPAYILILFLTIIIDYFAGILIENASGKRRKQYLYISLVANIGVLAIFKYYNFLNDNITEIFTWAGSANPIPYLDIILPIGLSFHTFQAMSYGLKLMAWGLFKKAVIADRLSLMVDTVYSDPTNHYGFAVILATAFFAIQIYCDFSGYSDMAIGAAQVMGFKLMTNFNRPYFAKSISEFWKRWHISLSTWFKDYLYVPLGGNRVVKWRWYFNLFITFMVSGLWHGANWTFIVWGALHGFYLVFALVSHDYRKKLNQMTGLSESPVLHKWLQSISVFVLVSFAWIFFRATTIHDAFTLIQNAMVLNTAQLSATMFSANFYEFYLGIFFILLLFVIEWTKRGREMRKFVNSKPLWVRFSVYIILILVIINFGVFGGNNFIYFQF